MILLLAISLIGAEPTVWKELSLGPVTAKGPNNPSGSFRNGALRARSISARTLIAVAAGISPARIIGSEWLDTERYGISAELRNDSKQGLRTRAQEDLRSRFQALLTKEIATRLRLETRIDRREVKGFAIRLAPGAQIKARPSKFLEGSRFVRKGTPIVNVYSIFEARGTTLQELLGWLERQLGVPVWPANELPAGVWDFRIRWRSGDSGSLLQAIREQVGLDVVEELSLIEFLVVNR